jgi:hypothetical protein
MPLFGSGYVRVRLMQVLRKNPAKADHGDELARRIEEARERVRPLVPEIDEQTLVTILASVLRPFGTGKHFLLKRRDEGGWIF